MQCPICGTGDTEVKQKTNVEGYELIDCFRCGKCYLEKFLPQFMNEDKSNFYKISSWIKEQNDIFNKTPKINTEKLEEILNMKDKRIKEKFDFMMNYFKSLTESSQINEKIISKCWLRDYNEIEQIVTRIINLNYINIKIEQIRGQKLYYFKSLTFEGIEYIENLEEPNKNSKNIFVAFNFTDELISIFSKYVKEAVESTGFTYTVVNQETTPHNQKITDEIVVKIKSSRIIIADFTNSSTNVYFEAGFAMGMKIPVIWTCKEGHEFSFDTGQFPHITWTDENNLKQQLINRIEAII